MLMPSGTMLVNMDSDIPPMSPPVMDVQVPRPAPPQTAEEAPAEARQAASEPAAAATKQTTVASKHPTKAKRNGANVSLAIIATVIIVLALAALVVFAYSKSGAAST
jgi:hypothetical protein